MKRKYLENASKEVAKAVDEYKHEGRFHSRKQAIAVGLANARDMVDKALRERTRNSY